MDIKTVLILLCVYLMLEVSTGKSIKKAERFGRSIRAKEGTPIWKLFQSKVVQAERYARQSRKGKGYEHYGVVITTKAGKRWLVHKGHGFSRHWSTVITDAAHMSERWKLVKTIKIKNAKVEDFLNAGGKYFHPIHDNAFHAVERMMNLG